MLNYEVITTFKEEDFISAFKSELPDLQIDSENIIIKLKYLIEQIVKGLIKLKLGMLL